MAKICQFNGQAYPKRQVLGLIFLGLLSPQLFAAVVPEAASTRQILKTQTSTKAMAVTANHYASDAALQILKQGGSAVDAAIAAQLVLGLVEPQSSGIGGGAFMLYWQQKTQQLTNFNGRETAPSSVTQDYFIENHRPMDFYRAFVGGHGVGVPGVLAMLELAHQKHGKLAWKTLFKPAIALAEEGFIVSNRLHELLLVAEKDKATMRQKAFVQYFYPNGQAVEAGTRLKNPAYANTLKQIAEQGAKAFYHGAIAKDMVLAVKNNAVHAGVLSEQDLANYTAREESVLCKTIQVYRFCGSGPPSSGPLAVMQTLALYALLPNVQAVDYLSADFYLRFIESLKLAMADRGKYVADPRFKKVPVKALLSDGYLKKRSLLIDLNKAGAKHVPAGDVALLTKRQTGIETEQPSTSHLVIIDKQGNIVSMTSSIEMAFGSRILVRGFLLNNQLTDFSFSSKDADKRWIANRIEPNKQPRSSMAPMIVFKNNQPYLAIGSPGGARIIAYVAKVLAQNLFSNASLPEAVAGPHASFFNGQLELEASATAGLKTALVTKGYAVKSLEQTSGLHIIQINGDKHLGIADGRREGTVATVP